MSNASDNLPKSDESDYSSVSELRDLLLRALERNGVISNVRAQLRSSVYTIIEQERRKANPINEGLSIQQSAITHEHFGLSNRISLALIKDYLKSLNLHYTNAILESEIALEEIDLESNREICLPNLSLPEKIEIENISSFNPNPEKNSENSNSSNKSSISLQDLSLLSKLIYTNCISKHKYSINLEFQKFLKNRPSAKNSNDILNILLNFSSTKHLPRNVILAYIDQVVGDENGDIDYQKTAFKVIDLISKSSQAVLSTESIFKSYPGSDKTLYSPT